jgi:hypothetical protein
MIERRPEEERLAKSEEAVRRDRFGVEGESPADSAVRAMPVLNLLSVVIETSRLVMRPVRREYAVERFAEFTPEVCRYMFSRPASQIAEVLDVTD